MDKINLNKGTLIKVRGLPFVLSKQTTVFGNKNNKELITYNK